MIVASTPLTDYFTDGTHLYEVVNDQAERNFGLAGGTIRSITLRECVTEAEATIDDLQLLALASVPK